MANLKPRLFPRLGLTVKQIIEVVAGLDALAFDWLLAEIRGPSAFDASKERVEVLATGIGSEPESIGGLLNGLGYLYAQVQGKGSDQEAFSDIISELLLTVYQEDRKAIPREPAVTRLTQLLSRNTNADELRKLRRLKSGFLPNATAFSTLVDLRPNFDEERERLLAFIPILQFRVATDAEDPDEALMVFQMDIRGLAKLKTCIEEAEKKLASVRKDFRLLNHLDER